MCRNFKDRSFNPSVDLFFVATNRGRFYIKMKYRHKKKFLLYVQGESVPGEDSFS